MKISFNRFDVIICSIIALILFFLCSLCFAFPLQDKMEDENLVLPKFYQNIIDEKELIEFRGMTWKSLRTGKDLYFVVDYLTQKDAIDYFAKKFMPNLEIQASAVYSLDTKQLVNFRYREEERWIKLIVNQV